MIILTASLWISSLLSLFFFHLFLFESIDSLLFSPNTIGISEIRALSCTFDFPFFGQNAVIFISIQILNDFTVLDYFHVTVLSAAFVLEVPVLYHRVVRFRSDNIWSSFIIFWVIVLVSIGSIFFILYMLGSSIASKSVALVVRCICVHVTLLRTLALQVLLSSKRILVRLVVPNCSHMSLSTRGLILLIAQRWFLSRPLLLIIESSLPCLSFAILATSHLRIESFILRPMIISLELCTHCSFFIRVVVVTETTLALVIARKILGFKVLYT